MRVTVEKLREKVGDKLGLTLKYNILQECANVTERDERAYINSIVEILRILFADDGVLAFKDLNSLRGGIDLLDDIFTSYGLTLAYSKTETMVVNGSNEETNAKTLISIKGHELQNTASFKYLGNMVSQTNTNQDLIDFRIQSGWSKYYSMKEVYLSRTVRSTLKGQLLNAFVRSRFCYGCAAWDIGMPESCVKKIEAAWMDMNRRIVRGGFKRKKSPPAKKRGQSQTDYDEFLKTDDWDYSFVYTNDEIFKINGTEPLLPFIRRQQVKWIGHCARMKNMAVQKQMLFAKTEVKYQRDIWPKLGKITNLDPCDLRRKMMDRSSFSGWLKVWPGSHRC